MVSITISNLFLKAPRVSVSTT
uniref:Uncharacterized protein n=1 Tax=Anguilla anguilla TaxID=7936 RepID=A0A0E9UHD7_ANGAN